MRDQPTVTIYLSHGFTRPRNQSELGRANEIAASLWQGLPGSFLVSIQMPTCLKCIRGRRIGLMWLAIYAVYRNIGSWRLCHLIIYGLFHGSRSDIDPRLPSYSGKHRPAYLHLKSAYLQALLHPKPNVTRRDYLVVLISASSLTAGNHPAKTIRIPKKKRTRSLNLVAYTGAKY